MTIHAYFRTGEEEENKWGCKKERYSSFLFLFCVFFRGKPRKEANESKGGKKILQLPARTEGERERKEKRGPKNIAQEIRVLNVGRRRK